MSNPDHLDRPPRPVTDPPPRLVFLAGPPGAGKSTLARLLASRALARGVEVAVVGFADELKERTHRLYDVRDDEGCPAPWDWFEAEKDTAQAGFFGLTPRQAYIAVAETLMKPLHGPEVFGELLLKRIDRGTLLAEALGEATPRVILIHDSGFPAEAAPLARVWSFTLVRLHREGHTFAGDSRAFWGLPDVPASQLPHPGRPSEEFDLSVPEDGVEAAAELIEDWVPELGGGG